MRRNDLSGWALLSLRGLLAAGICAVAGPQVTLGAERGALAEEFTATW